MDLPRTIASKPALAPSIAGTAGVKTTAYINLAGDISEEKAGRLMDLCIREVQGRGTRTLYFMISSGGGEVAAGVALYGFLKALPVEVVMHGIGDIDSIAAVIFAAGRHRYATAESSFLFHGVRHSMEESDVDLAGAEEMVAGIKSDQERIAGILEKETNFSRRQIKRMFRKGELKTAEEARKKGLVHEVRICEIPKGGRVAGIS